MKTFNKVSFILIIFAFAFGIFGLIKAKAATSVNLNSASNFAVIAASTVTNTGSSVINGDLALYPGTSVTGFPAGIINGSKHITDTNANQAQLDLTAAYLNAAGQTPVTTIATELGGKTIKAGIYDSAAGTFSVTGSLTLDAENNPDAIFIFKTASSLITDDASSVNLINGAQACNIYWQVGSSATLGKNSIFKGNILTLISATLTTGANVEGRVLSRNGAVTLDNNIITKATCSASAPVIATPVIVAPVIATTTATSTPVVAPIVTVLATSTAVVSSPIITTVKAPSFPNAGVGSNE